ncbi:hypothetical protein DXG03_006046 [Asterophora parasitica]|uniref:Uncharacterized protein n=1 Tax=Asterophora parasitica TaxID=117018 RepID=A0A9P7G1I4_9AGAR|nr:hypothetical protein DXG03_006046 [Asterophora parasitica]
MAKSTTSLNAQVPLGTRTISAAAFRRPQRMASGDLPPSLADGRSTSPLSVKKRLPSSPYPQQREASPNRRGRSGSPAQAPAAAPTQVLPPIPTQDDDYDYLGAYVDTGSLPDAPGDARSYVQPAAGNHIRAQGYGEGRFATDLDGRLR